MEAPEKIYLFENPIDDTPDYRWLSKRSCKDDVEYVRKDVFIKEVDKFISTFFHPEDTELLDTVLNKFHEHMN